MKYTFCYIFFVLIFFSCSNLKTSKVAEHKQPLQIDCTTAVEKFKYHSIEYISHKDSERLDTLEYYLKYIDENCDTLKSYYFYSKFQIFMWRKDYDNGADFIKRLESDYFEFDYQKEFNWNVFSALSAKHNGDSASAIRYWSVATDKVELFLESNPCEFKALSDLYLFRYAILDTNISREEVDSLKRHCKDKEAIIEMLPDFVSKNTIFE